MNKCVNEERVLDTLDTGLGLGLYFRIEKTPMRRVSEPRLIEKFVEGSD